MTTYEAKTEISELRSELRSAQAKIDADSAALRATATATPEPKADTPKDWNSALAFIAERDGCSLSEAGATAAKEYPHLHPVAARGRC